MTWFVSSATPAATRADADASFHRGLPYGRARNQRLRVATAYRGTTRPASVVVGSSSQSRVATPLFTAWKSVQSMTAR